MTTRFKHDKRRRVPSYKQDGDSFRIKDKDDIDEFKNYLKILLRGKKKNEK